MTARLAVGVVFSARPWRAELQRYVRDHVVGVSLRLVRDPRVGLEEAMDVMVVDDEASFLTPAYVGNLRARGVRIVGVYDPASPDDHGRAHLERLGVDATITSSAGPEDLLVALRALGPDAGLEERFGELVAGLDIDVAGPSGQVVAVGGPSGAGATEVAIALCAVAARTRTVVLVDVDEVNPGVARRLGLGLHPHLLTALDALHDQSGDPERAQDPLAAALAHPVVPGADRLAFDVVVGLANREDWSLARGGDVAVLIDALRSRWAVVVVNLGPHLEDLSRHVDRFGASRAAVGVADSVVAVCEGSPRGLLRYFDWLTEASALAPRRPVHCLLNRVPRSRYRRGELLEQLSANAGAWLSSVDTACEDRAVRRAEWDAVAVGRGPFSRAVDRLGERVLPAVAGQHRRASARARPA